MKLGKETFGSRQELFLGLALMIGLLLPHTSSMLLFINPLLCIVFFLQKKDRNICREGWAPIIAIMVSIVINMAGQASGKSLLTAASILLCIVAFPMVNNVRLKNIYIYLCFGLIFISQVGYMLHLGFVTSIIDKLYPITWGEDFITIANENASIDNYLDFRLGGLYRNPNHCAKYVSFLLAIYIVFNIKRPIAQKALFMFLCYFSIMLTGSRTGFAIGSILVLMAFLKGKNKSSALKYALTAGVLVLMIYNVVSGGGGRGAKIEEGFHGSADMKWKLLMDYLAHEDSIIHYLIGHLDLQLFNPSFDVNYSFDAEYGYLIYCFGFIGFFAFIYYFYKISCHIEKQNRVFLIVALWMLTSSIFFAYRAVFVFMLLLSTIYRRTPSNISKLYKQRV